MPREPRLSAWEEQRGEDRYPCLSAVPGLKPLRAWLGEPEGRRAEGP